MSTYFENDIDKTSKAVTKILRQTLSKDLAWVIDSRKVQVGEQEDIIGNVYYTTLLDKFLRLFKYKSLSVTDYDGFIWTERYKLQFIDDEGFSVWEFPYSNAVKDLYEAVSFKSIEVQEFLDKWLSE
jgi:hypothetical protein